MVYNISILATSVTSGKTSTGTFNLTAVNTPAATPPVVTMNSLDTSTLIHIGSAGVTFQVTQTNANATGITWTLSGAPPEATLANKSNTGCQVVISRYWTAGTYVMVVRATSNAGSHYAAHIFTVY